MAKGGQNERTKCKQWSLWWSDGERDDVFWRTSGSGARATQRAKTGQETTGSYGDMGYIDVEGKPFLDVFTVEFKKGYSKDLDLLTLLDGKGTKYMLLNFLQQVMGDAERAKNLPLLEIHRDRKSPLVFVPSVVFHFGIIPNTLVDFPSIAFNLRPKYENLKGSFVIMRQEDFFKEANKMKIINCSKNMEEVIEALTLFFHV